MELGSIASGSSGNCLFVRDGETVFLVDAGVSKKKIVNGLLEAGIDPKQVCGIFVTHEHNDHIAGLGVFLRAYPVPVYATGRTIDAMFDAGTLGKVDRGLFASVNPDERLKVDGITVEASRIYHDAADPVSYTFTDGRSKVGEVTDFGTFDEYLVEKYQDCETLLVEANHDLNMLMVGPYPYPLKRRIMGNKGHLSNERAGQFLSKVLGPRTRHILLGHLSKNNNYAELAFETVRTELILHNMDPDGLPVSLQVASRSEPTLTADGLLGPAF